MYWTYFMLNSIEHSSLHPKFVWNIYCMHHNKPSSSEIVLYKSIFLEKLLRSSRIPNSFKAFLLGIFLYPIFFYPQLPETNLGKKNLCTHLYAQFFGAFNPFITYCILKAKSCWIDQLSSSPSAHWNKCFWTISPIVYISPSGHWCRIFVQKPPLIHIQIVFA